MKKQWLLAAGMLVCVDASAFEYEWEGFNLNVNSRLTAGVMVRMEDRSYDLLGKENVPGQQFLCAQDTCTSLSGDNSLNQRLVDAAGGFAAVNNDDGDLNYDTYDPVAAPFRLMSDLKVTRDSWTGRLRAIAFYDPVNVGFDEHHNDTRFQPAETPRSKQVENIYGKGVDLYDAFVQRAFNWKGREGALTVGYQSVRWGESTLIARNSVAELNAPDSIRLHTPGADINEVFQPVAAVVLNSALTDNFSAELVYQLEWRKVQPDPAGSFFADLDLIDNDLAAISLGQLGEDRERAQRFAGPIALISSSSGVLHLSEPKTPKDSGQYGVRLNYFMPDLLNGTDLSVYFLNYHSRYPYATAIATDASCTRGVGPDGVTSDNDNASGVQALLRCRGFNGSLLGRSDQHNPEREPLPIDTLGVHLEYPENIQMYAVSFNTNLGEVSLAGEFSYRPNLPLQISINDLIFTALQPAFPANDLQVDPTGVINALDPIIGPLTPEFLYNLEQLGAARFPGANSAVPSYLKAYRGYGAIQPHQEIPGYERFAVGQASFTAIKAFSENIFAADQILLIGEVGFTQIYGLPDKSVLQLEGGSPNATHASMGQDEKGPDDYATLNPHRQTEGFGDDFAWGVRSIVQAEYNDVMFGWTVKPQLFLYWDIHGTAPLPIQNFVEGRKQYDIGATVNFTEFLSATAIYQTYTGGGRRNTLRDRDNLAVSVAYTF